MTHASPTKHFTAYALILLLAASFLSSTLSNTGRAQTQQKSGFASDTTGNSQNTNRVYRTQQMSHTDMPHLLAASYYSLNDNLSATLMLSNQGPHPMTVQPTLFSLTGQRLDVAPMTLEGNTVHAFDIREWALLGDQQFRQGSLQVLYNGKDMELGGVVKLVDAERSLIFDEELSEPMMFASSRLEGVWWLPSHRSEIRLAVSNTTDAPLPATISVDGTAPGQRTPETITLQPHETRVLNVRDLDEKREGTLREVGGLSINHSGAPGALLARAMIQEPTAGYSFSVEFYDPLSAKSSRLDGAGLRIGKIAGEELTQSAVARNVGKTPTILTGRMTYTQNDGHTGVAPLPDVRLAPGETREINLAKAIKASDLRRVAAAGLEFSYSGAPGSVVMAAQSMSTSGNQVFRVPMVDAASLMSSTGQYPWSLDNNSSTFVYLKNATTEQQQYTLQINYEGGVYALGLQALAAGQAVTFDVRKLRDNQAPDANGRKLPLNANGGQIHWSTVGEEKLGLIGRVEQVDLVKGMSMTSACMECCPDSWYAFWVDPGSAVGLPGDTGQFIAMQQNQTCYGDVLDPYQRFPNNFTSSDPSVASCDSTGFATALDGGTTNIGASWTVLFWDSDFDGLCHRYLERAHPTASCSVQTPTSLSLSIGSLRTHNGGSVTDCAGNVKVSTAYGYSRLLTYTVLDQSGRPIRKSGMTATEEVYGVDCNPTNACPDVEISSSVQSDGTFCDVQSFSFSAPPPPASGEFVKLKQYINITTPGHLYAVRVNCINQQYNDVTITDITSNPDAHTCR